ncbi:amidohydrolase [Mycobacterium sp. NAZ190054]|uniref:amidohydrolase n=1 Tax=Mycobacterium sp. NAZ190054 TaxID=1747766 RepID=UPI0018D20BB8|nr:amidohydrolase family protein [Mycobacterium sp. NAZ190054]
MAIIGRIVSVTGGADAEAVVIRDGRIAEVGSRRIAEDARAAGIEVRDVGDRAVVPGFVDPHIHLELLATARGRAVDCRVPGCKTIADVLDRLTAATADIGDGDWLLGYGNLFFDQKLAERRLPTRAELDRVSTTVPIQIACGGHTSVLNSRALELAQVERFLNGAAGLWGSPVVQLDDNGVPTGVVSEIDQLLPVPPMDKAEVRRHLTDTYAELFTAYGVTTFGEMLSSFDNAEVMDDLVGSGDMAARGVLYPLVPSAGPLEEVCEWISSYRSKAGADRMRAAGAKLFADGGYSARNAATRTPYVAEHAPYPGYKGRLNMTQADVLRAVHATRRHDVQVAIHANGPRAQDEIVAALLSLPGPHDHRPVRIEHAGNLVNDRADLERFRRANVVPVLQPVFLYNFMADFVPMLLGDGGLQGRLPLRSMLDDGVGPVASSDVGPGAEIEQSNPLFSIWECMARRSYWGLHIEPEQAISFTEALRLHTIEGARSLGMEGTVGSIEVGKWGDIAVLDRDPRTGSLDDVRNTRVDEVFLAGVSVHKRAVPA